MGNLILISSLSFTYLTRSLGSWASTYSFLSIRETYPMHGTPTRCSGCCLHSWTQFLSPSFSTTNTMFASILRVICTATARLKSTCSSRWQSLMWFSSWPRPYSPIWPLKSKESILSTSEITYRLRILSNYLKAADSLCWTLTKMSQWISHPKASLTNFAHLFKLSRRYRSSRLK